MWRWKYRQAAARSWSRRSSDADCFYRKSEGGNSGFRRRLCRACRTARYASANICRQFFDRSRFFRWEHRILQARSTHAQRLRQRQLHALRAVPQRPGWAGDGLYGEHDRYAPGAGTWAPAYRLRCPWTGYSIQGAGSMHIHSIRKCAQPTIGYPFRPGTI